MANNENLGASFSIDVTNLKAGLTQANRMIRESESEDGELQARLEEIQDTIANRKKNKDVYDDSIVRQMVECIKVYHDGRIEIIFGGGYTIEETLEVA